MTDNPQPRTLAAALAQLAGSRRALTTVMLELREAREENERLVAELDDQNDDGCGWKPVAEDAIRLLRDCYFLLEDNEPRWYDSNLGSQLKTFMATDAVRSALGEAKHA